MSVKNVSDRKVRALPDGLRTWIEIDTGAARRNIHTFRSMIGSRVKLWPVVKSNAYGHGLVVFSKLVNRLGADGFCVDSIVEGVRLREERIRKPILVLGPTLQSRLGEAAARGITLTVSTMEAIKAIGESSVQPAFHVKIDTGMHRQGIAVQDVPRVIDLLNRYRLRRACEGLYTHFASAKDITYTSYTDMQLRLFNEAYRLFEKRGYRRLRRHAAATGGTLISKRYHLHAVRLGIGLYGLYPSKELEMQLPKVTLTPLLRWRTVVSEIKKIEKGAFVGYDLVERIQRRTIAAVLPIGYWHGLPRALSSVGEVIVRGRRARILGRISMDLTVVDVTGSGARVGDHATIIGRDGGDELRAFDVAQRAGTIHYELITRLNPLMERMLVP